MLVHQIAEFTGIVASQSLPVVRSLRMLPSAQAYSVAVRSQARAWRARLLALDATDGIPDIAVEVLVGEMLNRVWCGAIAVAARSHSSVDLERLARLALVEQLDVSRQILRTLIRNSASLRWEFARLDKVRRQVERWTDLLLSPLLDGPGLEDFAFEAERVHDFSPGPRPEIRALRGELTMAGLRTAFAPFSDSLVCAAEQSAVIAAILAAFPESAFALGSPLEPWADCRSETEVSREFRRPQNPLRIATLRRRSQ